MAGNATNAGGGDEVPKLPQDEDEGEAAESTVAMASPSFAEHAPPNMPLPISNPPPGFLDAPPLQMPPTAPVPFVPPGAIPAAAKPPVPSPVPPGVVGNKPAPKPPGASPFGLGHPPPKKRAQTVIGIAPPAAGAQTAPAVAASSSAGAPAAPARPPPVPPSASRPFSAPATNKPATPAEGEAPTMMGSTEDSLALFGLDEAAGNAARAAALGPAAAARRSPSLPKSPFGGGGGGGGERAPEPGDELATVAVPKDDLERARAAVAAPDIPDPGEAPPPNLGEPEEESTRAVPREELLRANQGAIVVGEDSEAQGEDATLAVAPGQNEANKQQFAAFAQTVVGTGPNDGAFPPPPPQGPQGPQAGYQVPPPPPQVMAHQQWNQQQQGGYPGGPPSQQQQPPGSNPHFQMQQGGHPQQGSNPHLGSNPHIGSNPHMLAAPQSGQMPISQQQQQQQQGQQMMGPGSSPNPIPYPGHLMGPGQQGIHQGQGFAFGPSGRKIKLSGQILMLAIVGVVCLAIFITGIVLFATTKFSNAPPEPVPSPTKQ